MDKINIDELKSKINVRELLYLYGFEQVTDSGEWFTAVCPYHEDRKPSFSIRKSDTYFHCWSCPAKGDAIKLVMDFDNLSFTDALKKLLAISGLVVSRDEKLEYLKSRWAGEKDSLLEKPVVSGLIKNDRLLELNWWAKKFFESSLPNSIAEEYIVKRGFNVRDLQKFDLGYYNSSSYFIEKARNEKFTDAELETVGFITSDGDYERFSNRLMFPIYDLGKHVVAFSGRSLNDTVSPKYMATPNSDYYKKGYFLYGLQNVVPGTRVILVEGNLDCIRLNSNGMNTLAQLGTALTEFQCSLLKSITDDVVLLYDGDEAGLRAAYVNILPLIEKGIWVKVAVLPIAGYDPDKFTKEFGILALETDVINKAKKGLSYFQGFSETGTGKSSVLKAVSKIKDPVIKMCYIDEIAELLGLSESSIRAELRKV